MAPSTMRMPQSAYHLYFRFCRNLALDPSLELSLNEAPSKESYKNHIETVLNADLDDIITNVGHKYCGSNSFAGMSKTVGTRWKHADALTRSVFKDLAKEDMKRYKKVCVELLASSVAPY